MGDLLLRDVRAGGLAPTNPRRQFPEILYIGGRQYANQPRLHSVEDRTVNGVHFMRGVPD